MDGAGVFVRVVGPELGPRERPVRKVPYLLASADKGDSPADGAAASCAGRSRLVSVWASSSELSTGT